MLMISTCNMFHFRVQHLRSVASSLGLDFNTNRSKFSNTLIGHALLEFAKEVHNGDKQDEASEKLFKVIQAQISLT